MGKKQKKRRALSEYDILDLIVERLIAVYGSWEGPEGPPGPPGPQGPPGAPGYCRCASQLPLAPWQAPIVSYADYPLDPADTSIHVSSEVTVEPETYEKFSAVSVPYLCGCTWVGLSHEQAPEHCPSHTDSKRKRS